MSRSVFFEPLKRHCRNWLRKRSRILPTELPELFFYAKNIDAAIEYFSTISKQSDKDLQLTSLARGSCYVCKQKVDFTAELTMPGHDVNWRETLACPKCGLINRWRSCLHVFEEICQPTRKDRIYLTETLSPVYRNLAVRFPRLVSSEYLPDAEFGELTLRNDKLIRNEDVTSLGFDDASMDIILCFDVLEHVVDYRAALAEFYRVLGAGGQLLLSVPVSYGHETLVRATVDADGHVKHLVEPCYHGDPLSDQGVLSYYDFGLDLLDDMRDAGFEECFTLCFNSAEWGYLDDNVIFVARKLKSSVKKINMVKSVWQGSVYQWRHITQNVAVLYRYVMRFAQKPLARSPLAVSRRLNTELQAINLPARRMDGAQELPEIFHYWSNKYIAADLSRFGFSNPEEFFFHHTKILLKKSKNRITNILSIGSGDCELEIRVAQRLLQWQLNDFVFECLERDKDKLDSAKTTVLESGLGSYFRFTQADPSLWKPYRKYGIIIANQSLHESWNLEGLLDSIKRSLLADGLFLISDSIGRNLNMCWPETMHALKPFWDELPENYRYNRVLRRLEKQFINHDGSREGFGAIRSQDILALLLERFNFKFFFPYGNIIFVFISQSFGHNFNGSAAWDKDFIDRVHARDEAAMLSGELKPCSMLAALTKQETELVLRHPVLTPGHCVRKAAGDLDHASESRRNGQ